MSPAASRNDPGRPFAGDELSRTEARSLGASFRSFKALAPHLLAAAAFSAAAFALYAATMPSQPVPGAPAEVLERLAGLRPNIQPRFAAWRALYGAFLAASPLPLSVSSGIFSALWSALGVGAAYLFFSQLVLFLFERETWAVVLRRNPIRIATAVAAAGGAAAAVALGTSAPYWTTASQAYPFAFHLAWFLLSVFLLLRFAIGGRRLALWAFALLYGAGLAQTSVFLAHLPLALALVGWVALTREKRPVRTLVSFAVALGAAGAAVLAWNAVEFSLASAATGNEETAFDVAKTLVRAITGGVTGAIPRAWWLILLGLTVLPWLASLLVAKRNVNAEKGIALSALNAAVAVTTACVLLDLKFSPWQFYNVESLQIVPYAMSAMTFGCLVSRLVALALRGGEESGPGAAAAARARRLAWAAAALVPLCAAVALARNADDADPSVHDAAFRYVDRVLDGLQGRTWLVTPGVLDANLRIRAAERGLDVKVVNVAAGDGRAASEEISRLLPDVALRNAANVGPVALLREWIGRRTDADAELALSIVPDFWHLGPYEDIPSGPVFLGRPAEGDGEPDVEAAAATVSALIDEMAPLLAKNGDDGATARIRFYDAFARQRVSHAANNAAYLLERAKRMEEAWDLYAKTLEFDPGNVSCLLNRAALLRKGMHPEASEEVEKAMADLQAKLAASKIDIRSSLASSFGYVSSPSAFLDLGWRWALSGMSTLALSSLNRAMETADEDRQAGIRNLMAAVYRQSGDLDASEAQYLAVLDEDPGVPEALIGLVRICAMRGDFAAARRHMEEARVAGVPQERLLFESAAIDLASGDVAQAAAEAQRLLDFDPDNKSALVLLSLVHTQAFEEAQGDSEARKAALEALRGVVAELVRVGGEDDFQARFVRGRAAALEGKFSEARDDFLAALRAGIGSDRLAVMGWILQMDFSLADKASAERHAKETLTVAPDHPLANYLLGSIALEREKFASAEAYLLRSLETSPDFVPARNDLAMAQVALKKYDKAIENANRVLAANHDFYGAWDTRGCARLASGDAAGAWSDFETALQLHDGDTRVLLHVAMALVARGDADAARSRVGDLLASPNMFTGQDARDFDELRRKLRK